MSTLTTGSVLAGRYRLVRLLGQGGMGAVYLAHDDEADVDVAVKVLKPGMDDDDEVAARFRREGALRSLVSPHIARVLDAGEDAGVLYIVMEHLQGQTLKARLSSGNALGVPESLAIACDVARALVVAHAAGVAHRDVKPANIMLVRQPDGHERAVLLDFGIARSLAPGSTMTSTGMVVGTPGYIAPEVALGTRSYDVRSDLYALGVVLYECLAGAPPFVAATPIALTLRQAHEDPLPPGQREDGIPADVDALVMRLIARSPGQRPADAVAALAALEAARAGAIVDDLTVDGDPVITASSPYVELSYDPLARVARMKRTSVPLPSADDVGQTLGIVLEVFPLDERADKCLLIDVRDAPQRTDPRFQKIMAAELAKLYTGWRRVCTLLKTQAGAEQVQDLRRRAQSPTAASFFDEDAALTYLLSVEPPPRSE